MRHLHLIALFSVFASVSAGCSDTPSARAAERATVSASPQALANLATHPSAPAKRALPVETSPAHAPTPVPNLETPAPRPGVTPAAITSELTLVRFELAEAVEAREPLRVGQSFAQDTKVHAFFELANKYGAPGALLVKFEREGAKRQPEGVRLEVPTMERYRTHAFTGNTAKAGRYRCTVSTEDGKIVAQKDFEIVARDAS